jgi:hypothetical protein
MTASSGGWQRKWTMAGVVNLNKLNETQPTKDNPRGEHHEQAVLPGQVWGLLTQAHQQQVMLVMMQVGRILAQRETKGQDHESR